MDSRHRDAARLLVFQPGQHSLIRHALRVPRPMKPLLFANGYHAPACGLANPQWAAKPICGLPLAAHPICASPLTARLCTGSKAPNRRFQGVQAKLRMG